MADVKWIKITTDIFDDDKILLIESLPEADSIIVIWFKLLCLAGKQNNSGVFIMGNRIPYTDKMLATIFRRKEATVTMALKTFEQFGMIEIIDGVITIPNWGKHQNLDQLESKKEYMKNYMKEYREKQKRISSGGKSNSKTNSKTNVRQAELDIDKKKNKKRIDDSVCLDGESDKNTHGSHNNVFLTDDEFKKLQEQFPTDYNSLIERMSKGIATYGYKYESHYLAILQWVENDKKPSEPQGGIGVGSFDTETFFNAAVRRSLGEQPKTAADDESIKARAQALKEQLS